jgi:hypothetical protein
MVRKRSHVPIGALEAMTMENLLALDDEHLRRFENLCHHWKQLAQTERQRRTKEKRL